MTDSAFTIETLVVSPRRRFEGRPADGPEPFDDPATRDGENPTSVRVRAHKGLVGDRYFGTRFTYATMTLIAAEKVLALAGQLQSGPFDPVEARRNLVTRGLDVDALVRTEFTLDAGHGPIRFRCITPANPCAWMNEVFAPGAHQALRGHAGVRCEPLDDGEISVGPATVRNVRPLEPDELRRRIHEAPVA